MELHPCSPYTPLLRGKENITFYKWAVSKQIRLQDKSNTYSWKQNALLVCRRSLKILIMWRVFLSEALFKNSALFMALRLGHYKERAITRRHVVYRQKWKTNGDCQSTCPLFVEQSQLSAGRRLISSQQSARTRFIISCLITRPTGLPQHSQAMPSGAQK